MKGSLLALCALAALAVPSAGAAAPPSPVPGVGRPLTVMTRNLDAATDYGPAFAARTPLAFMQAAAVEWGEVVASDVPARMAGVAAEIAAAQPDVVSLQEATLFRTGPLSFTGIPHAQAVAYDQLGSLLDALAADDAHYRLVDALDELDVESPSVLGFDVRLTDRDALLVRSDHPSTVLAVSDVHDAHYTSELTVPMAVGPLTVPRGWIAADVTSLGRTTRVLATHLEAFQGGGAQAAVATAQARELLDGPAATQLPVVLACDCNTGPGVSATYDALLAGGLVDTWDATHAGDPGYTWPLHGEDPTTAASVPSQRIDLVLERGLAPWRDEQVGTAPLGSGIWASDHAGVVARLRLG